MSKAVRLSRKARIHHDYDETEDHGHDHTHANGSLTKIVSSGGDLHHGLHESHSRSLHRLIHLDKSSQFLHSPSAIHPDSRHSTLTPRKLPHPPFHCHCCSLKIPCHFCDSHPQLQSCFQRFKGITAMILATMLLSFKLNICYNLEYKLKVPYHKSTLLMWDLFIYTFLNGTPLLFAIYFQYDTIFLPLQGNRKIPTLLIIRGIVGSLILFISWSAIPYFRSTSPITVITAMAPIVVYLNAFLVLKEKLGYVPIINAVIAVIGVIVMDLHSLESLLHGQKDVSGEAALTGTGIALLAMYLLSWVFVIIRLLKEVHPLMINLSFGVFGTAVMFCIALAKGVLDILHEGEIIIWCFVMALNSTISNLLFNYALKHEQAGVVSLVRTLEVVFNFLYQYFWFGKEPPSLTLVGAAIVIVGVVCITLRKIVLESDEDSSIRKYLGFLKY